MAPIEADSSTVSIPSVTWSSVENATSDTVLNSTADLLKPPTVKINASDVAKFLLLTDHGRNPDGLRATFSQDLFQSFIPSENDVRSDLATSGANVTVRDSREVAPSFTDKAFRELLAALSHLWGDPGHLESTTVQNYDHDSQIAADPYFQMEVPDTLRPTLPALNSTAGVFVTRAPVYPWDMDTSQDELDTMLSANNTDVCVSSLVEASQWCYLYGVGFLLITALFLNCVSMAVFQTKALRRLPFSVYLTALAITDTIAIFGHIPRKWLNLLYLTLGWGTGVTFYDTSTIACKSITFISYVFRFASSWLLVALACERLSVSSCPYKPSKLRTMKSAGHGILYCIIAALIFNSHVLFTWKSISIPHSTVDTYSCVPMAPSEFISMALTITTILTIVGLPFCIIAVVTVFTIRNFGAWNLRPRRLSTRAICRALLERQATLMVVVISAMFCILSVPYAISWVVLLVQHFTSFSGSVCAYADISAARDISEVGFMVTYAIKFLICIFTGRNVLSTK